ncbi:MAG: hypothetical protein A2751_02900 [Candidatus Doudnabacteria bacterium RIFCSPHIGHO2_01_FULL_46_14]|uniref:DUF11 domain-containing protein n=1 Tax=Candidatus Doudnabacteria bacterium RIFCSPHIGHO2_01_FULL_46_14 TaxID=1817824 RepID=A0A1F5NKA1_9BACT|nr:MAG: hypothetical protein A2751_02900 [Candidatus Doudnabacteria bacterium RIFCSPHIGHO2_01_FULL_46_14]
MKSLKIFGQVLAITALAFAGFGIASADHGGPHTVMKFWPVTGKVVGGVYTETVQIFNTAPHVLDPGTLQVELDSSVEFVSSTPGATAAGQVVTISVPAIAVGGSFSANITVRAVSTDVFAVSSASYFVNGERVGFMGAPAEIDTTGQVAGVVEGDGVGGPTDEEALASDTLPRTGTDPAAFSYFTLGLLLLSWGVMRAKPIL